ncbi:MAG: acylphosphatase [candidate division WOR-3 bacterium]|nr:acylphosphatase [candidate division WOR-3 bacterium]
MKRIHLWVSGFVQGIGFRSFVMRKANGLGIGGWVKNLPDGRVEIVGEGEDWKLKEFVRNVKIGPSFATVSGVQVKEEVYKNEFKQFTVRF